MGARKVVFIVIACAVAAATFWAVTEPHAAISKNDQGLEQEGDAAKGGLIFAASDCSSCHASPGQSDRLRLGGGMALASPYGTFRPPNISSDPPAGIGPWGVAALA